MKGSQVALIWIGIWTAFFGAFMSNHPETMQYILVITGLAFIFIGALTAYLDGH